MADPGNAHWCKEQAFAWKEFLIVIRKKAERCTTGERFPAWLKRLVELRVAKSKRPQKFLTGHMRLLKRRSTPVSPEPDELERIMGAKRPRGQARGSKCDFFPRGD